jgi:hypothetical protein
MRRTLLQRTALIALATLFFALASPGALLLSSSALAQAQMQQRQQTQPEAVQSDVRAVLSKYGKFVTHAKYGEVWVPTVTPQGWHPYPPCQWVYTKRFGWYFDDKTPWGQIIHHFGRWGHDPQMGWIWVPGAEFSPGWVMWRTSDRWIGWVPTPPDIDVPGLSPTEFNSSSQWIFIEIAKMRSGCKDSVVAGAGMVPLILRETRFITEIEYVDGIAVFVFPPFLVGPIVDINIGFVPWPGWFFAQLILDWNWLWVNTNITINVTNNCGSP